MKPATFDMRVSIILSPVELRIRVNSAGEITGTTNSSIMPQLYAPWPEAQGKGIVQIEVEGNTLRALLAKIAERYKEVNVDLNPIDPKTNDVDCDYYVFVNGKDCAVLTDGLDAKLTTGDEVVVSMDWYPG